MKRKAYLSDISNSEWEIIKPLLPVEQGVGCPRGVDYREIINGIFYVVHEGCTWRALPHDLPPWQTVYNYFRYYTSPETLKAIPRKDFRAIQTLIKSCLL